MSKDNEGLDEANALIRRLVEWAEQMGGWEATCWHDAERYLAVQDFKQKLHDVGSTDPDEMNALILEAVDAVGLDLNTAEGKAFFELLSAECEAFVEG